GAHGDAPADGLHAIVGRADEREKAADWEGAISELSKAIELEPRNAGLFARRGALRERKGDPPGATADYRKSLELAPDGPQSKEAKAGLERCRAR
ncbi:hypothetical protein HY251_06350, partial [bacterium]|nr:hypothetical protein [bacterium]